ncbi:MAG: hypothetical protein JXR83_07780 [Deltaproteobacteria bacterium]|nr:hypothetical protein [Deltaproteobacteria bacterium]
MRHAKLNLKRPCAGLALIGGSIGLGLCLGSACLIHSADDAGGADTGSADAGAATVIAIRNAGSGPVYLDASLRSWCQTLFALHRADTGDRLLLPNAALCRCDDCEATACSGMVSWTHFVLELPAGQAVSYTWDHRYLADTAPSTTCAASGSGCMSWRLSLSGTHEVRISYSRATPVCSFGEEDSVYSEFLAPPGLSLPAAAILHQCVFRDTNVCAVVPLSASMLFDRDAAEVEVVLSD